MAEATVQCHGHVREFELPAKILGRFSAKRLKIFGGAFAEKRPYLGAFLS
jgi:hypothetical protein